MPLAPRYRKAVKFIIEAQRAAMRTQKKPVRRELVQRAAIMAVQLRVPKEKFYEAVKNEGITRTVHRLSEIRKIARAMRQHPEAQAIEQQLGFIIREQGIRSAHEFMAQKFEEAEQMGLV